MPLKVVEEVLRLYQEKYFDLNVRHFHEKLGEENRMGLSYTWVKKALQGAGLVRQGRKRGVHRPACGGNVGRCPGCCAHGRQPTPVVSGRSLVRSRSAG